MRKASFESWVWPLTKEQSCKDLADSSLEFEISLVPSIGLGQIGNHSFSWCVKRFIGLQMLSLEAANKEVAGDSDSEAEEDEGMGDIDIEAPAPLSVKA